MVRAVPRILAEDEVARLATMELAIPAIEQALRAKTGGKLVSPPRHRVGFPATGALVFTIGGLLGASPVAGFRVYDTFASDDASSSQLVAVWDRGSLRGILLGSRLGDVRTGAIGALAVRHMARADADVVGVIGTGAQARTQLEGAAAVRHLRSVKVHSRSAENRRSFAEEMEKKLGVAISPVTSAREAVDGADIVLCATNSSSPVIQASWLKPGAHVTTVGPKTRDGHEISLDVAERAACIATDSPDQVRAYGAPFFLDGTPCMDRMVELADLVTDKVKARSSPDAVTLFCSVGLAGTEVLVGTAVLDKAEQE